MLAMQQRSGYQMLVLAVFIGSASPWPAKSQADEVAACRALALNPVPESAVGAVWRTDGMELVVTDTAASRLIRYSSTGRFLGLVDQLGMEPYNISSPTDVHATPKGFVVRNQFYYWVWFDHDFKPLKVEGPTGDERVAMVDEVLLSDGDLTGIGSIKKPGKPWLQGLVRVRPGPLRAVEIVEEMPFDTAEGSFHRVLYATVAAAGSSAYALRLANPPFIERVAPRARLKAFPGGFSQLPTLPPLYGPSDAMAVEKVMSQASIPTALYGSGRFLFLLTRQPADKGTAWKLHKIDPEKDRLVGSVTLPTTAFELVLAPGPEKWAILEKGPSDGAGHQKVTNLLLVSKRWIEEDGLKPGATVSCN